MVARATVMFAFLLLCWSAITTVSATNPVANRGYFGGELSAYASGDTIMYVYYNTQTTDPDQRQYVKFCISTDGGANWSEYPVTHYPEERVRPTLTVMDDYILVHVGYLYRSYDLGQTWTNDLGYIYFNFAESTPYVFEHNGALSEFRLRQPYPEWDQYDFTLDGTEDILLPPYFYYTENDMSPNNTSVYFSGYDNIDGIVFTNGDLKIKQAGGGDNNGWPRFNAPVMVGGNVVSTPSNYPVNEVFPGGLYEQCENVVIPAENPARESGIQIGNGEDFIYLIEVNGANYSGWQGELGAPYRVRATVYDEYPPAGDSLFVNNFTIRDTLWTPIQGGLCSDREFFVDGELWIKGEFSGKQTWTSSGMLKIIGDITLSNTTPGEDPNDNSADFVTLLSEKRIELKYGYKNPADSVRIHPMCGPDSEPHYIYANLYAIGKGQGNSFQDGVFTYEYQHPHPSTPAVEVTIQYPDGTQEMILFDWIDLHRRHYPQTAANPWPSPALGQTRLDLPWYNPLWPERNPYLERGTLKVWGNIYQRRRGFLHRSYNDGEYPTHSGVWDIEYDRCGYPTNPVAIMDPVFGNQLGLMSRNYPGAAGSGTGYKKAYHPDLRTHFYREPDNFHSRLWQHGIHINKVIEPYYFLVNIGKAVFNEATQSKSMDAKGGQYVYAANDVLLYDDGVNPGIDLSALTRDQGLIVNVQLSPDQHPVLHQYRKLDTGEAFTVITEIDPNNTPQIVSSFSYPSSAVRMPEAFCIMPDGRRILARYQQGMQILSEILPDGTLQELDSWYLAADVSLVNSRLHLKAANSNTLDIFLWLNTSELEIDGWGDLTHLRKQLPVSNSDNTVPAITRAQLNAYPNPVKDALNINVKLPAHREHSLEIFNIRGQKVRSYATVAGKSAGEFAYEWDLKDEKHVPVSRGVYILRLTLDGKETISRRITVQ
jgi:hypothetical protein